MRGAKTICNWKTPIFDAIKAYADSNPLPFHMPGHKLGKGIPSGFISGIEKLDLTELPDTDNLHAPSGVVKEAQELCAAAFGAEASFFLVNGSTVGLHAAISAVCEPGQRLIVGRDSHRAVFNGMLIAGAKPYYILPEFSDEYGINTGITPEAVEKALSEAPDAAGVLITRPNYYGICSDIVKISEIVHAHGKILIVDEAHGAHLVFNRRLPVCALEAGADLCVQSAHKTLPAFTQGAYLHVGSKRADKEKVRYFLDIYQTTSPSFIIMAFLDIAREIMQKNGEAALDRLIDSISLYGENVEDCGIRILNAKKFPGFTHDPTRIAVNLSDIGISGFHAEKLLRRKYNIQAEMSDLHNIVFIATVADGPETVEYLFKALRGLAHVRAEEKHKAVSFTKRLEIPEQVMEPLEVLNTRAERIPLKNAAGRVSRNIIAPYPPGIAVICPGEKFGADTVDLLMEIVAAGGTVQGVDEEGMVLVAADRK
ncbi:MAG: aminotransferase class I/II-fold pyridoxal phosphate-dependent enzyme [Acetivibrionales bacterium]